MKRTYEVRDRADKRAIREFLKREGQFRAPALGAYRRDPNFHDSPVATRDSSTSPEYDFLRIHGVRVRQRAHVQIGEGLRPLPRGTWQPPGCPS